MSFKTIIEPFKIKMVEPINMTTPEERELFLKKAHFNTFMLNSDQVLIDFLTWPPDGRFMEFNVFRLARSADGKAVVSLQLAYRFRDATANGAENLKRVRDAWIRQATAFDMRNAHAALGK